MKKLEKFSINPEKVIKNEELVNLRGGYGDGGGGGGGSHYLKCTRSWSTCSTTVDSCDNVQLLRQKCTDNCYGWTSYICV